MSIHPLFEGEGFSSEDTAVLYAAWREAIDTLGLTERTDLIMERWHRGSSC